MTDNCLQAGKPSWYTISHPYQLSLAIPPWTDAISTSESWCIKWHTIRCTTPISSLAVYVGVWLREIKMKISAGSKKTLVLLYLVYLFVLKD